MSRITLAMVFFFMVVGFSIAQTNIPIVDFDKTEYDFGDLNQGDKKEIQFKFKNNGSAPLIISDVHVQCGCTAPEWPSEPVLPGESGEIKISYDSKGKEGVQRKVVTIKSNAMELYKLKVLANVVVPN